MKLNKIGEVWNSANWLLSDLIGLLSSKNVATMATWRNDFSSRIDPKSSASIVLLRGNATSELKLSRRWWRKREQKNSFNRLEKFWKCSTLLSRFLCLHSATYVVKLDGNGKAIVVALWLTLSFCFVFYCLFVSRAIWKPFYRRLRSPELC